MSHEPDPELLRQRSYFQAKIAEQEQTIQTLREQLGVLETQRADAFAEYTRCAGTPLMVDVLRERDELQRENSSLRERNAELELQKEEAQMIAAYEGTASLDPIRRRDANLWLNGKLDRALSELVQAKKDMERLKIARKLIEQQAHTHMQSKCTCPLCNFIFEQQAIDAARADNSSKVDQASPGGCD